MALESWSIEPCPSCQHPVALLRAGEEAELRLRLTDGQALWLARRQHPAYGARLRPLLEELAQGSLWLELGSAGSGTVSAALVADVDGELRRGHISPALALLVFEAAGIPMYVDGALLGGSEKGHLDDVVHAFADFLATVSAGDFARFEPPLPPATHRWGITRKAVRGETEGKMDERRAQRPDMQEEIPLLAIGEALAREIMSSPAVACGQGASLEEVAELLADREISGTPVVDEEDRVVGVISEDDLARAFGGPLIRLAIGHPVSSGSFLRQPRTTKCAADVMSTPPGVAAPETPMHELASTMARRRINRVPIVEAERLVGIVTRGDILAVVAGEIEAAGVTPAPPTVVGRRARPSAPLIPGASRVTSRSASRG